MAALSNDEHKLTIFQPPKNCNTIPKDHVPEYGFELISKCIFPKKSGHIKAKDTVGGQLMTFMFNVEQKDEVKCYLIWNGQTMRFYGAHLHQVLPRLFIDSDENKNFKQSKLVVKMQRQFDRNIKNIKFNDFYDALNVEYK
eukprot:465040_1